MHQEHAQCPRGLANLLERIHEEVKAHLASEEQILFPMILAGHGPKAGGHVRDLSAEHDDLGGKLSRLRYLTQDFGVPEDGCITWITLYMGLEQLEVEIMKHVHLENNVLFPKALEG